MKKILIIGDESVGAARVGRLLSSNGYEVIGIKTHWELIFQKGENVKPDLILIGIILPGSLDGIAVAIEIRSRYSKPILFIAPFGDKAYLTNQRKVFPAGYLLHPSIQEEMLESISMALKSGPIAPKEMFEDQLASIVLLNAKELIKPYIDKLKDCQLDHKACVLLEGLENSLAKVISPFLYRLSDKYIGLTRSELRVAKFIKTGKSTKEIAVHLDLSTSTINTHREKIRKKIGIKGKKQNLRYLLKQLE